MRSNIELPNLPVHPDAYTERDLVALWSCLDATGKNAVVNAGLRQLDAGQVKGKTGYLYVHHQQFCGTQRWPAVKWRVRCRSTVEGNALSVAALEQLIRRVSADAFLADECRLWRVPINHGHFAIGGRERRIVIAGLTSTMHYDALFGPMRHRLEELTILPPAESKAWAGEFCAPGWSETDQWLDRRSL